MDNLLIMMEALGKMIQGKYIKKRSFLFVSIISILAICFSTGMAKYGTDIVSKIKPIKDDIPAGFTYGKIPIFAKKVLKDNPWMMDKNAIKKLADKIYPDGNYNKISGIHVTIMTRHNNPFGDDIVCYIILYNNISSARAEIEKMTKFAEFNQDRVIVLAQDNVAVYLHVDDVDNFHFIKQIANHIEERISKN